MAASNVFTEIPHVVRTPYEPTRDLRPIASITRATHVMIAAPDFLPATLVAGN